MIRRLVLRTCALATLALSFPTAVAADASAAMPVHLALGARPQSQRLVAATVAAASRATLSTRMAASVQKVLVSEGARVKRGQLVLVLSADEVRAQLVAATTALSNSAAYERRISHLAATGAATPVELEAAQAQRAQAEAALAATRASLDQTELRAPFAGIVQARRVSAGDFVGPGQPLLDVEGAELELQATLSDEEAAGLVIGQVLGYEAGQGSGEARVTALTPGGDSLSHRRALRAKVTTAPADLRSGAFVRITLPGGPVAHSPRIPRTAIVQRGDLSGVFVADHGRARLRWLSLGEGAGDEVLVRAGLAGDEAVIDNPGALRDEEPITVVAGAGR